MDIGGAETHVFELACALAKKGDVVTVASSGGRLARELPRRGCAHIALPLDNRSFLSLVKARSRLGKLLKKGNFDIVHAHSRIAAFLAYGACRRSGIRMVTTIHAHYRKNSLLDSLSRWGSGVIAVSYDLYRHVRKNGKRVPIENVCIIPNGIDTKRFLPMVKKEKTLVIAFLSRLDADCSKVAFALCRIAEKLAVKYDGVQIRIGGGGSEYGAVKKLAYQVNTRVGRELIRALGEVDDTVGFFQTADVFVGVSRAALEAMSCAVPLVLAGDEGFFGVLDLENISVAESTNFCCRGSSSLTDDALLSSLLELLKMTCDERIKLGNELRKYVERTHSVDAMAERTKRFYCGIRSVNKRSDGGVLLCGYYGYENMGDDLLLLSSARKARQKNSDITVCVLTDKGRCDNDRFCERCAPRKNIFCVVFEMTKADTVVFGGGTLLQNATSNRSLLYYLFILRCAQIMGIRTELWGNGIGEIKGNLYRRVTAKALACCAYVGVRDKLSLVRVARLLQEYGHTLGSIEYTRDLALGYSRENSYIGKMLLSELGILPNQRFAVVIVRGKEDGSVRNVMISFLDGLKKSGIKLVFVAMFPDEDMELCRQISEQLSGTFAENLSPGDLFGLIKNAYVVCSMRYHGLVLAADAAVPFVGFGKEEKIAEFCKENGGKFIQAQ